MTTEATGTDKPIVSVSVVESGMPAEVRLHSLPIMKTMMSRALE